MYSLVPIYIINTKNGNEGIFYSIIYTHRILCINLIIIIDEYFYAEYYSISGIVYIA